MTITLAYAKLIHTCVGKKSQDFSGSLSGNTDLTELMTIWKIREMDKTLKNFLLEKGDMYYETCTVDMRLEIKERMHPMGSWYSRIQNERKMAEKYYWVLPCYTQVCILQISTFITDIRSLRTSLGTFHTIFKLVGFSSLLIFHSLIKRTS